MYCFLKIRARVPLSRRRGMMTTLMLSILSFNKAAVVNVASMNARAIIKRALVLALSVALSIGLLAAWQLNKVAPARSVALRGSDADTKTSYPTGAALFAFGDFGAIDLDTLETSAMPWPVLTAAMALAEAKGRAAAVEWAGVVAAFKRVGFLYPETIHGQPSLRPSQQVPLGFSLGVIERTLPPLRISAINIGCAACHAGPAYAADGTPKTTTAVLGRPNASLNLEAFSQDVYAALKTGLANETTLFDAIARLFPEMTLREKLTLKWVVVPRARQRLAGLASGLDKPLPFNNGAPGLTNGVGALKSRLGVTPSNRYDGSAGFVSVPDLGNRAFRSAFLADGAYAPKNTERFRAIALSDAQARDNAPVAALASFFMVPSMGLAPHRTEAAIPELTVVLDYLMASRPPRFPGPTNSVAVVAGRDVYARACANCHGTYDKSTTEPRLLSFPNWAGDVGTDRSRLDVFNASLKNAIDKTGHGQRFIDTAVTQKVVAPLLSGLWSSAPYLTNGSIPTLRHFLTPQLRPARFMTGGHRLSMTDVGIDGVMRDGVWVFPAGYRPYARPVVIDTTAPGFSNRGHDKEVEGLSQQERDDLLEYLKLL
jgi:mono/diheme cytochrome c family protein